MIFPKGKMRNEPPPDRDKYKGIGGGSHMAARHRHRGATRKTSLPGEQISS